MKLDPVSLRLFVAVMEENAIARAAAAREHIAASAASRRLAELEDALGVDLFARSNRGSEPTAAAYALLHMARGVLNDLDGIAAQMGDYRAGVRGQVRVVANISAITQFLPGDLQRFMAAHPQVQVRLEEQISSAIARSVAENAADIGILNHGNYGDRVTLLPYREDELVLVAPRGHALARRRSVRLAEALHCDFVGVHPGSAINNLLTRAAADAGRPLRLRIQVTSYDALCLMVSAGLGVGVLPRGSARLYLGTLPLRTVALAEPWARRQLSLCVRAGDTLSSAARLLVDHLRAAPPRGGRAMTTAPPLSWDVFCRVIDNFGDIGVCWRLAAQLGALGHRVRLWTDDATALAWMAPGGAPDVQVLPWPAAGPVSAGPGDVLVEAFGCDIPEAFLARLPAAGEPRRPHGAPCGSTWNTFRPRRTSSAATACPLRSSPVPAPGAPAGSSTRASRRARAACCASRTWPRARRPSTAPPGVPAMAWPRTRWPSRCSAMSPPACPPLLRRLCEEPRAHLLATPGRATAAVRAALADGPAADAPPMVTCLPHCPQPGFDEMLWACDLNAVRGEDSLVRALWAGQPFVLAHLPAGRRRAPRQARRLPRLAAGAGRAAAFPPRLERHRGTGRPARPDGLPTLPSGANACRRRAAGCSRRTTS